MTMAGMIWNALAGPLAALAVASTALADEEQGYHPHIQSGSDYRLDGRMRDSVSSARFKGKAVIGGQYVYTRSETGCSGFELSFQPDQAAQARLPVAIQYLAFANDDKARTLLDLHRTEKKLDGVDYCTVQGRATLELGTIETDIDCDNRWFQARLLKVRAVDAPHYLHCARQRCRVQDPTGTPLNVRRAPSLQDVVVARLDNARQVDVDDLQLDQAGREWALIRWKEGQKEYQGWAVRGFLSQCSAEQFQE